MKLGFFSTAAHQCNYVAFLSLVQEMGKGMLQLLSNCPAETAHLRKELLIAAKHILTTELRNRTSARPLPACLPASERGLGHQPAQGFWLR